jgi:pSer/pThr/pTyr-binding forkhead associated (FHA) protein
MTLPATGDSFPEPPPDSYPSVLVVTGTQESVLRPPHLPITIGRKSEKDIYIADARKLRDHAMIVCENGQFFI